MQYFRSCVGAPRGHRPHPNPPPLLQGRAQEGKELIAPNAFDYIQKRQPKSSGRQLSTANPQPSLLQ